MKLKELTIVFACFWAYLGFGQELPTIIPPSPEASALAKFTEVPVSHYTGLPNVSVPIYTIQQKGIEIPISLNYHARGIQVAEIAPRTGLGWSLSYGGAISRQVRGKCDECSWGYLGNAERTKNYSSDVDVRALVFQMEERNPDYDNYPDQFTYGAGQLGGKFVLDYNDEKAVPQEFGKVDITYSREGTTDSSGPIEAFVVKDAQGNTYYYGVSKDGQRMANDYSVTSKTIVVPFGGDPIENSMIGNETYYNSWHLMDVETAYGEIISYYYDREEGHVYNKSEDNLISEHQNVSGVASNISYSNNIQYQLSRIEFNQGSIVFEKATTEREDYVGYTLDAIYVYEKNDTNFERPIKTYRLDYEYTTAVNDNNILWYLKGIDDKANKRLFLKEVQEEGVEGASIPPYTFEYNPIILPNRFSTSQDFWGYYNGADNGEYLTFADYGTIKNNKRVDVEKSEAGILKKISYPTGGITEFTYEHNKGLPPSHFSQVYTCPINPKESNFVELIWTKDDFTYNNSRGVYEKLNIVIPKTTATYEVSCMHFRHEGDITTPDCIFDFTMQGETDVSFSIMEKGSKEFFLACDSGNLDSSESFDFFVHPQSYTNAEGVQLHLLDTYDFQIKITYNLQDESTLLYSAGKRIKQIKTKSENTTLVKEYEYFIPNTDNTSGNVIGIPNYYDDNDQGVETNPCYLNIVGKYYGSGVLFSSYQPNSIGYSHVTEYYGSIEANEGKTEYTYTFIPDTGGDYYIYPFHPPADNEWLRGKNLITKIYKKEIDSSFSLVKEITNSYLYGNVPDIKIGSGGLVSPSFIFTPFCGVANWHTGDFPQDYEKTNTLFKLPLYILTRFIDDGPIESFRFYYLTGGTQNLASTTEVDYHENGEFRKETNYFYDYDNHYQIKGVETVVNNEDTYKTTYYYPVDKDEIGELKELSAETLEAVEALLSENRLEVLQTQTHKNETILSTVRNNYKTFSRGLTLPETIQTSKAKLDLEDRVIYHSYDGNGNPTEVSKEEGTHIVYIWGYQQSQPIAKIENITSSEISNNTIVNLQTLSNNDIDEASEEDLREALKDLREAFPKAMITTYTYDPLIGVTSITDPRGQTVYYEYDEFNRLEFVKDHDGNILSENQYHYQN